MPEVFSPSQFRHHRTAAGLSVERLARLANRSTSLTRKLDAGECQPSLRTLAALADALGCRVADLLEADNGTD